MNKNLLPLCTVPLPFAAAAMYRPSPCCTAEGGSRLTVAAMVAVAMHCKAIALPPTNPSTPNEKNCSVCCISFYQENTAAGNADDDNEVRDGADADDASPWST